MSDKYISKYSNNKPVSAAQYITEMICEHKAKKEKKDLHFRFWTLKEWSRYYRDQIGSANKLLKQYSAKAIVMALKEKDAENIYSLRAPHLPPIIERCQKVIESQNTTLSLELDRSEKHTFRSNTPKQKNILSKLKDIDTNE